MKMCFFCCLYESAGATETVYQYYLAGKRLGVDVSVAGFIAKNVAKWLPVLGKPERVREQYSDADWYPLNASEANDIDLFVFYFDNDNILDPETDMDELEHIVRIVPRHKAIVIDADGKYNPVTKCKEGDFNHRDESAWKKWKFTFESLSDRIFQPSFRITQPKVEFFPFFGYLDEEVESVEKTFNVLYLGNNWHRWDQITEIIGYLNELRHLFPKIGIIGNNWLTGDEYWPEAKYREPQFFQERKIEVSEERPHIGEVVSCMARAKYAPILIRPILREMQMITPRMYETFAARVIPIIPNDFFYYREIYGALADELILGNAPLERLADMVSRESYYRNVVREIREFLRSEHSFSARLQELQNIQKEITSC